MFRLTVGFFVLGAAMIVAACSSSGINDTLSIGPNFPSMTLYATNSNQNAVSIYNQNQKSGTGPAYQIGGSSTSLNGPQYLAFDKAQNLWITNYNPSTNGALLVEIQALATGNVDPLTSTTLTGRPRGIAITAKPASTATPASTASPSTAPNPTNPPDIMVIADVDPTAKYPSQLLLFTEGSTSPYQEVAGPKPGLVVPSGVALDAKNRIYVTNLQGSACSLGSQSCGSVKQFVLPTPSPTPSASPSPSPSPSASPSSSPSPSPSPSPTATPINITPTFTISGTNTGIITPTGVTVDASGYIYVADQGSPGATCHSLKGLKGPAILIFPPQKRSKNILDVPPTRKISGCATLLYAPTDVKVDANGLIYVADFSTKTGKGIIYIFPAGTKGGNPNVPPLTSYSSPGAVTGLGLVP